MVPDLVETMKGSSADRGPLRSSDEVRVRAVDDGEIEIGAFTPVTRAAPERGRATHAEGRARCILRDELARGLHGIDARRLPRKIEPPEPVGDLMRARSRGVVVLQQRLTIRRPPFPEPGIHPALETAERGLHRASRRSGTAGLDASGSSGRKRRRAHAVFSEPLGHRIQVDARLGELPICCSPVGPLPSTSSVLP